MKNVSIFGATTCSSTIHQYVTEIKTIFSSRDKSSGQYIKIEAKRVIKSSEV